jgi:pyrimidine operon attenuation protein / uracil phosphoribosyltransferase
MKEKSRIMDAEAMERTLRRIAHEIVEQNKRLDNLFLVGIRTRGVPMAERLVRYLSEIVNEEIHMGILDITLYRDDLSTVSHQPVMKGSEIPFEIEGSNVILIDDVLYTGRTTRAAFEAILDFGRPEKIQLCVMIDRGHRELPIKANYVGRNVPTSHEEIIKVSFQETDGEDSVRIMVRD